MAGDWIKMRRELQSHPKVVRILSATASDKFRAIGGLHAVWGVFDAHSKDGTLHGYTPDLMDHIIGWQGFSAALLTVGWLHWDGEETLSLPEFDEHNGQSAKRRAEDQKRKRDERNSADSSRNDFGQIADKKRTREEKRREDSKPIPPSEVGKTGKPVLPPCPIDEIVNLYHDTCPTLPKFQVRNETRDGYIRARWKQFFAAGDFETKEGGLDCFRWFFADRVRPSKFLTGQSEGRNGKKPFVADLEWLMLPSNFAKVIEGKYT